MNKKWLGLGLGCIVILILISMVSCDSNKIEQVTKGHLKNYPDVTVGEAFNDYMSNEEWSYVKENGIKKVKVTGNIIYLGEESYAEVTFKLNDDDTFRVMSLKVDDEPMNAFMKGVFISDVYDEYYKYNIIR